MFRTGFLSIIMLASGISMFHPDPASNLSANLHDIYLLLCIQY